MLTRRTFCVSLTAAPVAGAVLAQNMSPADAASVFASPPLSARPDVLWMWMGANVTTQGITRDLEAMHDAGIGGATIMALADITTPWAGKILKNPTPEIVAFTEPWWAMLRHAAQQAQRLGIELMLHNCPGYETSGGPWIPPELSMQDLIWSELSVTGGRRFRGTLARKTVSLRPNAMFPKVFIPELGRIDVPNVAARGTFYRDVALIAVPAAGVIAPDRVLDLSDRMDADGRIDWRPPAGEWMLYRIGRTTTGEMTQPAQHEALGLECDKMNPDAVKFHVDHVVGEVKKHLGDLAGTALTAIHFDSYETRKATWTPRMIEEFGARRRYALAPWLPVLMGRIVVSEAKTEEFRDDFQETIRDLYRDAYWKTTQQTLHAGGFKFSAEPYDGPWRMQDVAPLLDVPTAEFWTNDGGYFPLHVREIADVLRTTGDNLLAAEAFTTNGKLADWTITPGWLKPIGDAAFCEGVNRMTLHHFALQPWEDAFKPGVAMGMWGVQFGRNQTWWEPGKAWLQYLRRCQALLQRGVFVPAEGGGGAVITARDGNATVRHIRRRDGGTEIFFLANIARDAPARIDASFPLIGRQPELWDPVTGQCRDLHDFTETDERTRLPLDLAPAESMFLIFRKRPARASATLPNFPAVRTLATLDRPWTVRFDPAWGGPAEVRFDTLSDWTERPEPGIHHYSGTARYLTTFDAPAARAGKPVYLDLGEVRHLAEVIVNGTKLGVIWTAPWRIDIGRALRRGSNRLEIRITNNWANRLIGDEREPADMAWGEVDPEFKSGHPLREFPDWFLNRTPRPSAGRRAFTTWNYFTADSPLQPSGLIGPVRLMS